MSDFDGRRRRYVPMDVHLAHGNFGTKLVDNFGLEGLALWMLYLAACKRSTTEGTLIYTSDDEGWTTLGARPTAPGLTLDTFWRFTGQQKKTSRTRHGRISYVTCTVWGDWNKPRGTPAGSQQKPRSEDENTQPKQKSTRKKRTKSEPITTPDLDFDLEGESDNEVKPSAPGGALVLVGPPKLSKVEGRDLAFDALAHACRIAPRSERQKDVAVALNGNRSSEGIRSMFFDEYGGTGEAFERMLAAEVRNRAALYRRKMPDVMLTPLALRKWWLDLPGMNDPRGNGAQSADAMLAELADEIGGAA